MKMVTLEGSLKLVDDALISGFKDSVLCEVLSQGDSGYDESRVIYNGMFDIKPALILRTITVDDVVKTVTAIKKPSS